jgi:hypothetical protein
MKQTAQAIRRRRQRESPETRKLRSRNFKKLDEFLSSARRQTLYDLDFTPVETSRYEDPVVQRFSDLTSWNINSKPQLDFDAAVEFEHFLDSYHQAFLLTPAMPRKTRKRAGRPKERYDAETVQFGELYKTLSRETSLGEAAKIREMAKRTCSNRASEEKKRKEGNRIRRALIRLGLIQPRSRKPKSKE